MWHPTWRMIAVACLIFIVRPIFAMPSDEEVANWTSKVLILTLAANYQDLQTNTQYKRYRKYYSGQATTGISTFFKELRPIMLQNKLSTTPLPLGPSKVTGHGRMNGVYYWQVTQSFSMSGVDKEVWFSVIVTENKDPPLLIESLNMKFRN